MICLLMNDHNVLVHITMYGITYSPWLRTGLPTGSTANDFLFLVLLSLIALPSEVCISSYDTVSSSYQYNIKR